MLKATVHFDKEGFRRKVMSVAKENMLQRAMDATRFMRCKAHHQTPTVRSSGELSCSVHACCEDFKREVEKAIEKAFK